MTICNMVYSCDKACQKVNWPNHKLYKSECTAARESPRKRKRNTPQSEGVLPRGRYSYDVVLTHTWRRQCKEDFINWKDYIESNGMMLQLRQQNAWILGTGILRRYSHGFILCPYQSAMSRWRSCERTCILKFITTNFRSSEKKTFSSFRHKEHSKSKWLQTFVANASRNKTLNSFSEDRKFVVFESGYKFPVNWEENLEIRVRFEGFLGVNFKFLSSRARQKQAIANLCRESHSWQNLLNLFSEDWKFVVS